MKKLIIGLLLSIGLVGIANADEGIVMYSQNTLGGITTLTDSWGKCYNGHVWYIADNDGNDIASGCWLLNTKDNEIFAVSMPSGVLYVWNISDFTATDYGHTEYGY